MHRRVRCLCRNCRLQNSRQSDCLRQKKITSDRSSELHSVEYRVKPSCEDQSDRRGCHHQKPSTQCEGCQADVRSRHFDALAALYSPDFIYPDSSVEVLDNVETFIARLERFGNVDRPRQKERSSGRN
jgi:hypothetical protein